MSTIKEALEDGSLSLEDEIDYDDTPQGEEIACLKIEIERLHSIIKEVREEIRILETNCDIADYQAQKLFQILDKVGSDKE